MSKRQEKNKFSQLILDESFESESEKAVDTQPDVDTQLDDEVYDEMLDAYIDIKDIIRNNSSPVGDAFKFIDFNYFVVSLIKDNLRHKK